MIINAAESFNILASGLSVLHNYFDDSNKIISRSAFQQNRSFHIVLIVLKTVFRSVWYNDVDSSHKKIVIIAKSLDIITLILHINFINSFAVALFKIIYLREKLFIQKINSFW